LPEWGSASPKYPALMVVEFYNGKLTATLFKDAIKVSDDPGKNKNN